MRRVRVQALEQRVQRTREVLAASEEEAARWRQELLPTYDVPVVSERLHAVLDWITAWVNESRHVHQLAVRELQIATERRRA